tara:strand:- start:866 stop:1060 length:195 start_codon:yes stop_codon:yes gene_type:complete
MSNYSSQELGFIRAMARELIVNNNKEYENIAFAIQDAESFLDLFNSRYAKVPHGQVDGHDKSER